VLAVDLGPVTNGAGQWLSGTMLGAVTEYQRHTTAERTAEAQARAVARGVAPWPSVPPGYVKGDDRRLVPDPETSPLVVKAFQMRAEGLSVMKIRAFLEEHGIKRSYRGVETLLASRVPLGEIRFGGHVNRDAHPAIVDRDLWARVQRVKGTGGRRAKSDRLLARLGVLRCGGCRARMVITLSSTPRAMYRCPPTGVCDNRATISARKVEDIVVAAVKAHLADAEGRASTAAEARKAKRGAERTQEELNKAIRRLAAAGVEDEPVAIEEVVAKREERDAALDLAERLGGEFDTEDVKLIDEDVTPENLPKWRALIQRVVETATVAPGRGAGRVSVEFVGE
jgi:recombinase/recombinase-like zinc beta ribbon protein